LFMFLKYTINYRAGTSGARKGFPGKILAGTAEIDRVKLYSIGMGIVITGKINHIVLLLKDSQGTAVNTQGCHKPAGNPVKICLFLE